MNLHLVGGFLGSGKTTAIIQAAKVLMKNRQVVGVITNDQGKYLVDTAFMRLEDLPTVEVTGGCFCCNYDDLNQRLAGLLEQSHPQVVFAESVGSCADLVATVVKPLLELGDKNLPPTSFSVFADARLLLRRLRGLEMPFSEDVVYIFDQQIDEAGLVVVNKIDLVSPQAIDEIHQQMQLQYPRKQVLLQSSLSPEGVVDWIELIQSGTTPLPSLSLDIDYARYAAGEANLAWLDQLVHLQVQSGSGKTVLETLIQRLVDSLKSRQVGIGHLKFLVESADCEFKLSVPAIEEPGWRDRIPMFDSQYIRLLVNARVEMRQQDLVALLDEALQVTGVKVEIDYSDSFHPKAPKPTHRLK